MAFLLARTLTRRLSADAPAAPQRPPVSELVFMAWFIGVPLSFCAFADANASITESIGGALLWPVALPVCAWDARRRRLDGNRYVGRL